MMRAIAGSGRCFRSGAGFTLIEMILAITIFAMVIGVIYSSFQAGISAWQGGERDIAFHQSMRAVTELIFREISSTYAYKITPGTLDTSRDFSAFFGARDSLMFVSTATLHNRVGGLSVLELWVDDEHGLMIGEAPALFRSYDEMREIDLRRVEQSAVLSDWVKKVSFRYFQRDENEDDGQWLEQWDPRDSRGHDLPFMVEVTLLFEDVRKREIEHTLLVPIMSLPF